MRHVRLLSLPHKSVSIDEINTSEKVDCTDDNKENRKRDIRAWQIYFLDVTCTQTSRPHAGDLADVSFLILRLQGTVI